MTQFESEIEDLMALASKGNFVEFAKKIKVLQKLLDQKMGINSLSAKDLLPPWIIKTVQLGSTSTEEERRAELKRTGNNIFMVRAGTILLDFLTDSGTGAQSDIQWAKILSADERYAHSDTYEEFLPIARQTFNKHFILPVHQGRAAENIVFEVLLSNAVAKAKQRGKTIVCTGNAFFDTTLGNTIKNGAQVISADCPESQDTDRYFDFKGNADPQKIIDIIKEAGPENIGFIMMTVVNNTIGGQPVSMKNLKEIYAIAKRHNILFLLDSARIFENAYFIKQLEAGYAEKSISEITHEMTSLADVVLMSGKKDAIVNMGGLVATDDEQLYQLFRDRCILVEGHYSYGGMSGRDLAALAQGLKEGSDEEHLRQRVNQVAEFGNALKRLGIPIQWPTGSHGVFLDARRFLPHIDKNFFPGQRLCAEIYSRYGIRPVEIGLSLVGRDVNGIKNIPATDLVRFTVPRRVYTGDHLNFVIEALADMFDDRDQIGGLIYDQEGLGNGHFTSTFKMVEPGQIPELFDTVIKDFTTPKMTYQQGYLPPNVR